MCAFSASPWAFVIVPALTMASIWFSTAFLSASESCVGVTPSCPAASVMIACWVAFGSLSFVAAIAPPPAATARAAAPIPRRVPLVNLTPAGNHRSLRKRWESHKNQRQRELGGKEAADRRREPDGPRPRGTPPRNAPGERAHDRGGRDDVDEPRPTGIRVAAGGDAVPERQRPDREVEVVRTPPEGVGDPVLEPARERDRSEQLGADDARRRGHRPVRRREGDHHLAQREADVGVHEQAGDVQADERPGQGADETVHVFDREARPARQRLPPREQDAQQHRGGEEPEGHHSARARDVPGDVQAASRRSIDARHASFITAASPARKRPGRPRPSSHAGPSQPSRKAAFAATSAATQVPAATVTWSQGTRAGRPVAGSTRWCCSTPPCVQRRRELPLVAMPPASRRTEPLPGRPTITPPRTATSPPAET